METITHPAVAFADARGEITNIIGEPVAVAVITCKAGAIRGNHRHTAKQWMYLISGRYLSFTERDDHDDHGSYLEPPQEVGPGDLAYCPPGEAHAYLFLAPSVFLSLTPAARHAGQPEADQTRVPLLYERGEAGTPPVLRPLPEGF